MVMGTALPSFDDVWSWVLHLPLWYKKEKKITSVTFIMLSIFEANDSFCPFGVYHHHHLSELNQLLVKY